jgi:hypothetical protein
VIKLPIAALVVVVALLGGFYGGYKIGGGGASAAASSGSNTINRTGTGSFGGGAGRFAAACPSPGASAAPSASGAAARRATSGTLTNLTSNSLTVHDARCNIDEKVTFDSSVIIRKLDLGQTSDLQENQNITVTGTRQADGSIKANSITIGAPGGAGFGGFGGGGGANAG